MRIALLAPFGLRAKGTARARALPIGRALVRRGHEVTLFVPPYDDAENSGLRWVDDGVAVVHTVLPPALRADGDAAAHGAWHLVLGWRLYAAARAWQPEVVHVFKPKGPSGLAGALFWVLRGFGVARRRGAPAVVVDSDDWEGFGGWNDDARTRYTRVQRAFFARQERYGLGRADAWTVASECLRQRAIGCGAAPGRVFLLSNGVAAGGPGAGVDGQRAGRAIGDAVSVLLYTRFAGVRVADVADIWARVRRALPGARLRIVGRGVAGEEAALADEPGVDLAGWVEPEALPALLGRMGIAIAPWADTPSNRARHSAKVLELMAAGLPIVAYAVGELPATIGEGGVLVTPGDADAFARAVVELAGDPERAARLGEAGRRRAGALFDWDDLVGAAIAAYRAGARHAQGMDETDRALPRAHD